MDSDPQHALRPPGVAKLAPGGSLASQPPPVASPCSSCPNGQCPPPNAEAETEADAKAQAEPAGVAAVPASATSHDDTSACFRAAAAGAPVAASPAQPPATNSNSNSKPASKPQSQPQRRAHPPPPAPPAIEASLPSAHVCSARGLGLPAALARGGEWGSMGLDASVWSRLVCAWGDGRSMLLTGAGITMALSGDSELTWSGFVSRLARTLHQCHYLTDQQMAEFERIDDEDRAALKQAMQQSDSTSHDSSSNGVPADCDLSAQLQNSDFKAVYLKHAFQQAAAARGDPHSSYACLVGRVFSHLRLTRDPQLLPVARQLLEAIAAFPGPLFTSNYDCLLDSLLQRKPLDVRGTADDAGRLELMFGVRQAMEMKHTDDDDDDEGEGEERTGAASSDEAASPSDAAISLNSEELFSHGAHRRYVIHVHGIHTQRENFVLTPDEYHRTSSELHSLLTRWIDGEVHVRLKASGEAMHLRAGRACILMIGCGAGAFDTHLMRLWHHLKLHAAQYATELDKQHKPDCSARLAMPCAFLLCDGDGAAWRVEAARHGLSKVVIVVPYGKRERLPAFLQLIHEQHQLLTQQQQQQQQQA